MPNAGRDNRRVHYRIACVILDMSQSRDMLCSSIVNQAEDNRTQILRQWLQCSSYGRLVGGTVAWDVKAAAEKTTKLRHRGILLYLKRVPAADQ